MNNNRVNAVIDHKGNRFYSERAMCRYWGVNVEKYILDMEHGKLQSEVLGDVKRQW